MSSLHLLVRYRLARMKRMTRQRLGLRSGFVLVLLFTGAFLTFFTPQLEAMMDMPVASIPAARPALAVQSAALPPPSGQILALDTFQRSEQPAWGRSDDGQSWMWDTNGSVRFGMAGQAGLIVRASGGATALLGPRISDVEVVCNGSLGSYKALALGMVLRWVDAKNWYKTYLDGSHLVIMQDVGGVVQILSQVAFTARPDQLYLIRFRAVGNQLEARVWLQGDPEPTNWMVQARVSSRIAGYAGMSLKLQMDVAARMMAFMETNPGISA